MDKSPKTLNSTGQRFILYVRKILWETITVIVPTLLMALFLNVYIVQAVEIESGPSMQPNLFQGYRMMTEKVSYRFHEPERGDVVVVDRPGNEVSLVKRVMALPGETVEVHNGHVLINGVPIDEPWITYFGGQEYAPAKVPEGYVFIVGDNRIESYDSRSIGPVPADTIMGRVWLVYWPLKNMQFIP